LANFGAYTGYLTGHNSLRTKAVSEFFGNVQGYEYVSGVKINFGKVRASSEEATATITVWNARGLQNGPGSVVEQKVVLLKQIAADIAANRSTLIVFDRETPVFSRPYHVGVELNYGAGDSLAVISSANGQATNSTSWLQDKDGVWNTYAVALGANIAMDIKPMVGVNPSVQVSSSKLIVNPGEEVVLNGKGASIFIWNSDDGKINNVAGPQIIVTPTKTTTYTTTGSGLALCNETATTTIYVRENIVGIEEESLAEGISLYPNPGTSKLNVVLENSYTGSVSIQLHSVVGSLVTAPVVVWKQNKKIEVEIDNAFQLPSGVYLVKMKLGEKVITRKWLKH
jgi:hypothetical protein